MSANSCNGSRFVCGPIYAMLKIRRKPPVKTYVEVFACFAPKAVHFEALSDLTTDCFLCTLNRFIQRRGRPRIVWCDNATNFVGATNVWSNNGKNRLKEATGSNGLTFNYIPPRAANFGGLSKTAVKSAKTLLIKTTGSVMVNEDLTTFLA